MQVWQPAFEALKRSGEHRRTVGQDDDTHERISDIQDTVKDKRLDERPVSERCAAQQCRF